MKVLPQPQQLDVHFRREGRAHGRAYARFGDADGAAEAVEGMTDPLVRNHRRMRVKYEPGLAVEAVMKRERETVMEELRSFAHRNPGSTDVETGSGKSVSSPPKNDKAVTLPEKGEHSTSVNKAAKINFFAEDFDEHEASTSKESRSSNNKAVTSVPPPVTLPDERGRPTYTSKAAKINFFADDDDGPEASTPRESSPIPVATLRPRATTCPRLTFELGPLPEHATGAEMARPNRPWLRKFVEAAEERESVMRARATARDLHQTEESDEEEAVETAVYPDWDFYLDPAVGGRREPRLRTLSE